MNITMMVNRVHTTMVPKVVMLGEEEIEGQVPQMEVELIDPTGQHGSLVLRLITKADRDAAAAKFTKGEPAIITV